MSWNASGPTCTRALKTRCGIEFYGSLAWTGVSGLSHQLPHGLIPTLPAVAAYLPRYHGHRSTNPIRSPPQRASFLQPLSDSRPVLYRQHTPHQQPPPRQALLLRPYDTAHQLEDSPPEAHSKESLVLRSNHTTDSRNQFRRNASTVPSRQSRSTLTARNLADSAPATGRPPEVTQRLNS